MTTPITATVVEVPPPERPDLRFGIYKNLNDTWCSMSVSFGIPLSDAFDFDVFVPGTARVAADRAERERLIHLLDRCGPHIEEAIRDTITYLRKGLT